MYFVLAVAAILSLIVSLYILFLNVLARFGGRLYVLCYTMVFFFGVPKFSCIWNFSFCTLVSFDLTHSAYFDFRHYLRYLLCSRFYSFTLVTTKHAYKNEIRCNNKTEFSFLVYFPPPTIFIHSD